MVHPFNFNASVTSAQSPEIILGSVNTYLDQYEPLNLLLATLAASTVLFLLFPRVNFLLGATFLSGILAEYIRTYLRDYMVMNPVDQTWFMAGFSGVSILMVVLLVMMLLY
jgi:hypothetical protein